MQFDSIRNLFANAVERSARKSTGQGRYESKNQPRTRALVLESLETRELLSATPLETASVSEIALASQETTPLDALDLSAVQTAVDAPTWKSSSSTGTSVTVAWNPVANASEYVVEYKSSTDTDYTVMPQTTATAITIPNLAPETTYKLRVYAVGDGVNYSDSAYSTIKAVKTKVAPVDPTPLTVPSWKTSSSTYNSVTITWNPVANASGYVVEYKSSTDSGYTVMPKTTATTFTIQGLAANTTYKLRVYAAGDGVGYADSAYSTVKAVKTKAAPASAVLDEAFAEFFDEGFFE